jgi:dihydroorotase
VHEGVLTPLAAAARLSHAPARILGLEGGRLARGVPADLTLVDPDLRWRLAAAALRSAGHCTPFDGMDFRGRAVRTFHRGAEVFRL